MRWTPIIYNIDICSNELFTATCYKNRKWNEYLELYNISEFVDHLYVVSKKLEKYNFFKSEIKHTEFIINLINFLKYHNMYKDNIKKQLKKQFNNDILDYINYNEEGIINGQDYFFPKYK